MVKNDNLAPQKARLNFHQGILNSMLFNLFRPMHCTACVLMLGNYMILGLSQKECHVGSKTRKFEIG